MTGGQRLPGAGAPTADQISVIGLLNKQKQCLLKISSIRSNAYSADAHQCGALKPS
jgi:hypothetical protein